MYWRMSRHPFGSLGNTLIKMPYQIWCWFLKWPEKYVFYKCKRSLMANKKIPCRRWYRISSLEGLGLVLGWCLWSGDEAWLELEEEIRLPRHSQTQRQLLPSADAWKWNHMQIKQFWILKLHLCLNKIIKIDQSFKHKYSYTLNEIHKWQKQCEKSVILGLCWFALVFKTINVARTQIH